MIRRGTLSWQLTVRLGDHFAQHQQTAMDVEAEGLDKLLDGRFDGLLVQHLALDLQLFAQQCVLGDPSQQVMGRAGLIAKP